MSTATSAGVDYTVPPNVKGSGASNNHGAAARVGTLSTNFDNVSVSRTQSELYGSTVIDGDYTDEALSASTIAYNNQRPVGMRVSSTISGQSNTVLLSGADLPGQIRGINKRESFRVVKTATGIRSNKYNRYTNTWDSGYPVSGTESPGTDTAATPTRAVPGQLTYKGGAFVPVTNNDYKAKTG